VLVYDEFWSSSSRGSSARSSVSGDADGITSSLLAGSLATHYQHVHANENKSIQSKLITLL